MILPVILGPTCIGKTSLALKIAEQKNCDILSIDSRQVFKKLDVGTGKYKEDAAVIKGAGYWEVGGIKIWGYDILEPDEELNVLNYCRFAEKIINQYKNESKNLIITCGTGFYLKFLMGEVYFNDINDERKIELNKLELSELLQIFYSYSNRNPVDEKNKPRVITAILNLESPDSEKKNFKIDGVTFEIFRLTETRENLYRNADAFVEYILSKNVVNEFENTNQLYGLVKPLSGLIYREISEFKKGNYSFEEMKTRMKFNMHAYIRRQETFFNKINSNFTTSNKELLVKKILNIL